jgi:hypothetical protein
MSEAEKIAFIIEETGHQAPDAVRFILREHAGNVQRAIVGVMEEQRRLASDSDFDRAF